MPEPKFNRLTEAEYVMPDPAYNSDLGSAQALLMVATRKRVPAFFDVLADAVFPAYSERTSSARAEAHFQEEFARWERTFHIQETWLRDLANKILDHWHKHPQARANRTWVFLDVTLGFVRPPVEFSLDCEGWAMTLCSWGKYKDEVHRQLDEKLAEYEKESRKEAELYGLVRARQKFSESNFHWFALYQFGGRSYKQIVDELRGQPAYAAGDESTVRKGVKTASRILNWEILRGSTKKKP